MFNKYEQLEPIIYKQLKNALNGNLSHAYLFDLNNNIYAEKMIIEFIKCILCKEHNDILEYKTCSKCNRIENGLYQELKVIRPDGQFIKKEQLDELQKSFSTKPLESDYKIYIIYDADKLNVAAANSLLKFLEEPAEGIIAILLTNNVNKVMKTISSRCQILNFRQNNVEEHIKLNDITENVTICKIAFTIFKISDITLIEDYHKEFVDNVYNFIDYYETNKIKCILNENKLFLDKFKEKNEIYNFFECLILFYRDVINIKLNRDIMFFNDNIKLLEYVSKLNSFDNVLKKINIFIEKQKLIRNNINTNMLIDSLIIDMEENNGKSNRSGI